MQLLKLLLYLVKVDVRGMFNQSEHELPKNKQGVVQTLPTT